ncbi:hypothetical protein [Streptomyces sp. WZ-12]|uniref:hypothetical protein n=1 Tax=Streptomyces sp. WZ-12 TaxID=3030210 RepID=UPI002381159D|nr:hypothetical protein [Streptomyces sp. WZ-12]
MSSANYPYVGIDQSYSGFALVIYCHPSEIYVPKSRKWEAKRYTSQSDRLAHIYQDLQLLLSEVYCAHGGISLIAMEGYAHGAKFQREALGELGGIVKLTISEIAGQRPWRHPLIISPPTLKKFTTGKGTATKQEMMDAVRKRWGASVYDDNLADAYALARAAAVWHTGQGTEEQLNALQHMKPQSTNGPLGKTA